MSRRMVSLCAIMLVATGLTGCGKRGPLSLPSFAPKANLAVIAAPLSDR